MDSVEVLHRLLICDAEAGKLFWRERSADLFSEGIVPSAVRAAMWNTRYAGREALTTISSHGYLTGEIFNRHYRAHRVIWAMKTGAWPGELIDHVNGDRSDNRWENLRAATQNENNRNQRTPRTNTSGVKGVSWHKRDKRWIATIREGGSNRQVGSFTSLSDAADAIRAERSRRHGAFANHGSQ